MQQQVTKKPAKKKAYPYKKRAVSGVPHVAEDQKVWWELPEDKIAGAIEQLINQIDNNNLDLREKAMRNARLYGDYESLGWNTPGYDGTDWSNNYPVYNVIQSAVDTIHSKIARDNPKPVFITSNADYFVKLRAEKQTQFMQGVFQDNNFYDIANNKVFRDSSIYGTAGVQWELDPNTNKVKAEWVFIDELKIDKLDAMRQLPLSMHRCKIIQKERLVERYKDKQDVIEECCNQHPDYFRNRETVVNFCVVTESWHLRVGDTAGRHVVTIFDKVLLDEDYMEDWFPIVLFRYYDKPIGIFGRGIADTLLSAQIEINKILLMIQQCQELQAAPVIFVENGSEVSQDVLLSNNIARMIPYRSGTNPPTFLAPQAVSEEVYQHLQWWIQSSYQEVGISQTSVNGTKQSGVNSAVAMRTMVDIESSRFIQVSKNWEAWFVANAMVVMKLAKKAYENDKSYKITYMDKKSKVLKEIPWTKVNAPDDMFVIQCDTISSFPSSGAGRIQTITDFISNNYISKERGLDLLGIDPDLEDEIKLQTSSLRLCEKRLAEMVEDGIYSHPEDYMNLKLALSVSESYYNQLLVDGCPEERLQLVRMWIGEICDKIQGGDPRVALLQQTFAPPTPPPQAPQAGLAPANVQPQQ